MVASVQGFGLVDHPLFGRRDVDGEVEADEADQHDQHAPLVQDFDPGLAEEDDAGDHEGHGARAEDALVEDAKVHLRIAPKLMPRSRWLRSRKVKMATGSRNRTAPAAITVQSWRPVPT